MDPVDAPEGVGGQFRSRPSEPVFLQGSDAPVHLAVHILEMRRNVGAHIDRFLPEPPAMLGDVGHGAMVQSPQEILVDCTGPFCEANFNTVDQEFVLTNKTLLLHALEELWILLFENEHGASVRGHQPHPTDSGPGRLFRDGGSTRGVAISPAGRLLPQLIFGDRVVPGGFIQGLQIGPLGGTLECGFSFSHGFLLVSAV